MRGDRTRLRGLALTLALLLAPGPALAKRYTPEDAAAKRAEIESLLSPDPRVAIGALTDFANELGDPELFLRAAMLAHDEAAASRDDVLALRAVALAQTARDIGLYLADARNFENSDWQPVSRTRAMGLAAEAGELATRSRMLADEIVAERAAAADEAERARVSELERDYLRRRRGADALIGGGTLFLVIGAGGLGMLAAGLSIGQARQQEAEELDRQALSDTIDLPSALDRLAELDRQGARANVISYAGGAAAGVGIIVGIALVAVGVKKRRALGPSPLAGRGAPNIGMSGWLDRQGGGLTLQGRF